MRVTSRGAVANKAKGVRVTNQPVLKAKVPAKAIWAIVIGAVVLVALAIVTVLIVLRSAGLMLAPGAPNPTSAPAPTAAAQQSTEPEVQPAPTPAAPPPTVLPDCATINPFAQQENDKFVAATGNAGGREVGRENFELNFGPVAQSTMALTTETRGCGYIFSFHDGYGQYVSIIPAADQAALRQAVEADADFVENQYRGVTYFAWTRALEGDFLQGNHYTTHAFVGDVWIASSGSGAPDIMLPPLVDAMLEANPHLGTS